MDFNLDSLVRDNIKGLAPYSSAREEFSGEARVFLDANENSFGSPLNTRYHRYPDPLQGSIKDKIAGLKGIQPSEIFVGNGSDEAIDLLFRIFCRPRLDNVLICPPTYAMYEVAATINDVGVVRAKLTTDFELDLTTVRDACDENTKLIFICSPNNPTGNLLSKDTILSIAENFPGIVIVDEAYMDFSREISLISVIDTFPNLVVLQTFSKAWGLAGLRVGLAIANPKIIELFNKVKPPYNVSQLAQEGILAALDKVREVDAMIYEVIQERRSLAERLKLLSCVKRVYPSDANFLLVKTANADAIYRFLLAEGIVVRNRSSSELCDDCLRITVGTPVENQALLTALEKYEKSIIY
jgi:histidinol-phosphate aminotransferase